MSASEAIILAGGLGTRLQAVVSDVPKPLAPVAGRPFVAFLLDRLAAAGLHRCILAIGHKGEMIEAAIGHDWQGMRIDYSFETQPLGTGGALALAAARVEGDAAHVLNGDTYLAYDPLEFESATRAHEARVGLALAYVPEVGRYGAVDASEGRVRGFREKGGAGAGWINAGCYCFTRTALDALPRDKTFSLENDFIVPLVSSGDRVAAYAATEGFIDIGVPEDYALAQHMFAEAAQ